LVVLGHSAFFFWLQTGIIRFHMRAGSGDGERRLATLIKAAFLGSSLLLLLLLLPVAMAARPWLAAAGLDGTLCVAGFFLLLLRGWLSLAQAWNRARGLAWRFAGLELVNGVGAILLALLALHFSPGDPVMAIAGAAGAGLLAIFLSPGPLTVRMETRELGPLLREVAAYGAPLSLVFLAGSLLAMSDRLLVAYLVGPAAAGIYGVAFAIADRAINLVMLPIPLAAKPLVFLAFERDGEAAARRLLENSAAGLMALGFPAAVVLMITPQPITALLVGGGMADPAAEIVPWLALGSLMSAFVSLHFSLAFQLSRRTIWMLAVVGPPALLNVVANLLLLPVFGMKAAAWTTVGCYLIALFLAVALGRRQMRVPFPPGAAARSLLACVPLGLLLVGHNQDGRVELLWIIAGLTAYVIALLGLLMLAPGKKAPARDEE
jgi:O-antigen/teichoic acid export membrane protein